jgi:hypothetical protein
MGAPLLPDFNHWTPQELQKAEMAAIDFLNSNIAEIAQTFEKRLRLMRQIAARMTSGEIGFEERMMCLSMIQELSQGLQESAREFFEIGCQPSVANLISQLK